MSMVALIDKLITERGFSDEMLVNLTAMIDADIAALDGRMTQLQETLMALGAHSTELSKRKKELAAEFAKRRASLTALIGEEEPAA